MRLFLYYATHSLLNTLKKLFKTWVAIFLVFMIGGSLIGGIVGTVISKTADGLKNTTKETLEEVEQPGDEDGDQVIDDEDLEFEFSLVVGGKAHEG
jgi:hypothetical protein